MKNVSNASRCTLPLAVLLLTPAYAAAHTGVGATSSFTAGIAHPLTGLDHLLAIFAVGLWGAQLGGRATWILPATFLGAMTVGFMLGFAGVGLPMVELGIVASAVVLGFIVLAGARWQLSLSALLVALFAVCHGHAHGTELPAAASAAAYATGFLLSTTAIAAVGAALGIAARHRDAQWVFRCAGAAVLVAGLYLGASVTL